METETIIPILLPSEILCIILDFYLDEASWSYENDPRNTAVVKFSNGVVIPVWYICPT